MASGYEKLDSLILASITAGRGTFGKLLEGDLAVECKRIADAQGIDQFDRVLDRRLQALRKAKRIMHQDGRWSVIDSLHLVGPEEEARMRACRKRAEGVAG
ncbi:hypothetical protein KM864_18615 (plasmid) [Ralstonia solanacearum]|nr:hypothetical protein KM864_18615 [Ralstonia solanacearum]